MRHDRTEAPRLTRWLRGWRAPTGQEPADLGTAFGLEMSLVDSAPARESPTRPAQRAGWLGRWWRRA